MTNGNTDWKSAIINWAFQQGVSTVLLLILATFVGYRELYLEPAKANESRTVISGLAEKQVIAIGLLTAAHEVERTQMRADYIVAQKLQRDDFLELLRQLRGVK